MDASIKKAILESKVEDLPVLAISLALEPALKKVVEDSSNPVDDAIFAMVYPPLKLEIHKVLAKLIADLKA
jgi:hypothetical protein